MQFSCEDFLCVLVGQRNEVEEQKKFLTDKKLYTLQKNGTRIFWDTH